jgi:hypothetical protein
MSAESLRQMFIQTVELNILGDGKGPPDGTYGEIHIVAGGQCKSFEEYKERCGYIRGLNTAKAMMEECWQALYNPDPQHDPTKKG